MATYSCRSREELRMEAKKLMARYEDLRHENLKLDMSRGKPSKLQLDLVSDLLKILPEPEECMVDGLEPELRQSGRPALRPGVLGRCPRLQAQPDLRGR